MLPLISHIAKAVICGQRTRVMSDDSYICHYISTCTGISFISVNCINLTSDLLTPEFYSPNPVEIPPLNWNGLKYNVDLVPSAHYFSLDPQGQWNEVWTSQEGIGDVPPSAPIYLPSPSFCWFFMPKWSVYSLALKLISLLSPLDLSLRSPLKCLLCSLCPNLHFLFKPSPILTSFVMLLTESGSPCLKSYSTFYWYFGLGICSLPGTISYVIRYSYMDTLFYLREYSLFIGRHCVFCVLESLSEVNRFCPAYKDIQYIPQDEVFKPYSKLNFTPHAL